jgi:hypothetical protein
VYFYIGPIGIKKSPRVHHSFAEILKTHGLSTKAQGAKLTLFTNNLNFVNMKKLEKQQMETTVGGVSKAEYCETVSMILHNNAVALDSATAELIYSICGPI